MKIMSNFGIRLHQKYVSGMCAEVVTHPIESCIYIVGSAHIYMYRTMM